MDPSEMSPHEDGTAAAAGQTGPAVAEPAWLSDPAPPAPGGPADASDGRPEPPRPHRRLRPRRGVLLVAAAAVLVAAVVTTVGLVLNMSDRSTTGTTTGRAEPEPADTAWCAGLGAGTPASVDAADPGEAAIAGFERAYYVLRDGARAREHVAPDARVGSAEQIGKGIAQIPVGTTHCVLVRKATDGAYAVDVFERRPDGSTTHYPQTVLTVTTPEGTRITAITPREG